METQCRFSGGDPHNVKEEPRVQNTLLRQQEIIDAAGNVIVKYGSEHLTIRKIAKEVGIAEGTIYKHFRSKREILSLLADNIGVLLTSDIERKCAPSHSPLETLGNSIRSQLSAIAQRKGMAFQVIAEIVSLGDKQLNKKIHDSMDKYTSLIRDLLSEGVEKGEIREDIDLDAVASLIFSMVEGLSCLWIVSDYSFNLEQRGDPLCKVLCETIKKR
jgi:AcrR family transcriptional regulator